MSRQNRPGIVRTGATTGKPVKFRDTSGVAVEIDPAAASTMATAVAESPVKRVSRLTGEVTIAELRAQIGDEGLRQAAVDAGRRAPSVRTLQRWAKDNRIPHDSVMEVAQRRAAVDRLGGVTAVARMLGRSASSVYRWQSGKTQHLRGPAGVKMADARTLDSLQRARAFDRDGKLRPADVTVVATTEVRYDGHYGYEHRSRKVFRFAQDTAPMTEPDLWQLAHALAKGAFGEAVGVVERHASTMYPDNQAAGGLSKYDNGNGFHFEEVHDIDIHWLTR